MKPHKIFIIGYILMFLSAILKIYFGLGLRETIIFGMLLTGFSLSLLGLVKWAVGDDD